ncbi:hypothetical protein STRCI_001255 [Streptomyces cinnabarinus]|uniref:Uncharacterized protein n=1 Tax=Streptomyces cinnabarinus TaxID=67287 RepID=A0ABY7KBL7_9ACTN|nr:hypothetical protein [Streptomyces cinnabarinus]WAZ20156.1 hypothetical protein STRCI_001255 [Streptomyces cinnabarinus]
MDFPLWLWAIPAGSFAVLEGLAIANRRRGDTASELLRAAAGIKPARPWRPVGVAVIAGFCAWLANHLIGG